MESIHADNKRILFFMFQECQIQPGLKLQFIICCAVSFSNKIKGYLMYFASRDFKDISCEIVTCK